MAWGAANWRERPADADETRALAARGVPAPIARLLAARGVTADGVEAFFDPSLARLAAPDALPGIADAVAVILPFLSDGRKIVVFGDYDADGVCASAILVTALRRLGASADVFIPRRFTEGYGMTDASLARLAEEHPDAALVITVDNGVNAVREVARLREKGVAVVVTDHHLPGDVLPAADALVDPRVASAPGCDGLCGAGVAFFLVSALAAAAAAKGLRADGDGKMGGPLLVMAGVATVGDSVPLVGQNRILVSQALARFQACAPVGLTELYARAARRTAPLAARDFAFLLVPRLNAAGRMKTAIRAYNLLMTQDREQARRLAVSIDACNADRKTQEQRMERDVRALLDRMDAADAVAVDGTDWHPGVAGIVAARILEAVHVPVALAVNGHGSVRAPDGYNVYDALAAASDALVRFGGHAAAGGFTVKEGRFEDFRRLFSAACAAQRASAPDAAAVSFDGFLEPTDITSDLHAAVRRMEPFGEGNPEPVFGLRGLSLADARPLGADGRHLELRFTNRAVPRAVWWNHGEDADPLRAHAAARFDVLFTLVESDFGADGPHLEIRIVDLRPASFRL